MANVTNSGITLSSTSNLSSGQKIMIAEAQSAFEPSAPDPDIISQAQMPAGHKQHDVLTYARLADASALTEGVDYTSVQQLYANYLSINPTEHGVIVTLSKRAMRRQPESLESMAGKMMGMSLRAREAKDVIALYDGLSKSIPTGSGGSTLDITHVRGSVAYLMTDNDTEFGPAPMPVVGALHPESISDIIADLTDAGARTGGIDTGMSEDMVKRWWRGSDRSYGVQFFTSTYQARDSGDDVKGFLGSGDALTIVFEGGGDEPTEQDASHRLTEYGMFKSWGEGERADPHAVEVYVDAKATV